MQFNISAQEATSREPTIAPRKSAEQVRQILRSNGIDPKTAEFGYFSLQPVYDYKTAKRKLVGYRVNANVSLKLKDFSKVAPIVQQLADADVTETQSLNYTLEDMDAAKAKAVDDAYRRARESAAALARSAGRTLGELSYASVDTFENVRPMPMARSDDEDECGGGGSGAYGGVHAADHFSDGACECVVWFEVSGCGKSSGYGL